MTAQFTDHSLVTADQIYEFKDSAFTSIDYIRLGGAPDGSVVSVFAGEYGVNIEVSNPLFETPAMTVIYQSEEGETVLYLYKDMFVLKPEYHRLGIATTSLAIQVRHAQARGVSAISLYADGSYNDKLNGYYTWARLGFNMDIPASLLKHLPDNLKNCLNLQELMQTEEGQVWWLQNGFAGDMEFDLTPGSESDRIFSKYMEEKGIIV